MRRPTISKRLPAFHEEDEILALVEDECRGDPLEQYYDLQDDILEGIIGRRGPPNHDVLQDAFEKAQGGDTRPLAALLRKEHPYNDEGCETPIRMDLSDEIYEFLADVVEGIRNPRNGKLAGEPGRSNRISEEAQEKRRIKRRAERDFRTIRDVLKDLYPEKSSPDIRDLALKLAATRHKVDQEDLWTYMNRPKKRK
jgi:hypothetical protein